MKEFFLQFPILQTTSAKSLNIGNRKLQTASTQLSLEKEQTVSAKFSDKAIASFPKLTWSHFVRLLSVKDEDERNFYIIETAENNWKERELDRQINSSLFERLILSKDKKAVKKLYTEVRKVVTEVRKEKKRTIVID